MADLQTLEQLRDIHLPNPVGWWPLAGGWYFLVLALLLLVIGLTYYGCSRYRHGRAKRQALRHLAEYERQYLQDGDAGRISAQLSELLKRVALVYFPRMNVAGLKGEAWIDFLNATSKNSDFRAHRECLLELPYKNNAGQVNLTPLFISAKAWIKQRGAPCLN